MTERAECVGCLEEDEVAGRDLDDAPLCPSCLESAERCDNCGRLSVNPENDHTLHRHLGARWTDCRRCRVRRTA